VYDTRPWETHCLLTECFCRGELRRAAEKILTDPAVVEAVKKFQLPEDIVIQCDTWPYCADKFSTVDTHRHIQALLYARAPNNHPDSNQYAFPIPLSPVYDLFEDRIVRLDTLATGGAEDGLKHGTAPGAALAHCIENEYHPDLLKVPTREDLKPLRVIQPEGPSFTVTDENLIEWQKWRFRVGFNYREGLTIHDVRYNGRKVFYRLSISEMTVPYGGEYGVLLARIYALIKDMLIYVDPRTPYHRKQAFDFGDGGAGNCANNLGLGCDCLGVIKYFNGWLNDSKGQPIETPNVICLHEQDSGVGWKHTNHRTGIAALTRARTLVVQTIITVGNYEYIFAWLFQQNGTVELEMRATGIVSTALVDAGKQSPWGNVVSPGVLAQNHQHLFCMRIDPMLDGDKNTLIQEDSIPLPESDDENPFGNAWKLVKRPFEKSTFADAAPDKNRVFKIINENRLNRISGNPVGFKLAPLPSQLILAGKNSVVRKRARFAEHHIWVTRYRDGDLWAGGKWVNQSLEETDGVADYAARKEDVRDQDIVVWHTFGMTHNPRVEDFPVMPVEVLTVLLKPADFFEGNPALDVPQSTQAFNQSVLYESAAAASSAVSSYCVGGKTRDGHAPSD
jgi:primary-amine oxidase